MKILIGYDGSKIADEALSDLGRAGLPEKTQVLLLTAVPPLLPLETLTSDATGSGWYAGAFSEAVRFATEFEGEAKAMTAKAAAGLRAGFPGWNVKTATCVDAPAHGILTKSDTYKPQLVIVGSHGWSGVKTLLLGGVAEKVLHHAHANVRIAREPNAKHAGPPKILIGFDGSAYSEAAVTEVARRNWPKGTQVRILAASEYQFRMGEITQAINRTLHRKRSEASPWPWMEKRLETCANKLIKKGLVANPEITIADPREALLREAKKWGADAIFLGSRGHSGLKRFFLGSVSTAVAAHAPCSVEIIHIQPKGKTK